MEQVSLRFQPAGDAVDIVAHIHRYRRLVGIDRHLRPDRNPLVGDTRQRIVPVLVGPGAGRQRPDGGGGAALAIGHPGLDELGDGLRPVLLHQLLDSALGGAAGAHLGEVVRRTRGRGTRTLILAMRMMSWISL